MEVGRWGPAGHPGSEVCPGSQELQWGLWLVVGHPRAHLYPWQLGSGSQKDPALAPWPFLLGPGLWEKTFPPTWEVGSELGWEFLPPHDDCDISRSHQSAVKLIRNFLKEESLRGKSGTPWEVDAGGIDPGL